MAASPKYKIYTPDGKYEGCTKDPGYAWAIADMMGGGATIRAGHLARDTVWTVGVDEVGDRGYDKVYEAIAERLEAMCNASNSS